MNLISFYRLSSLSIYPALLALDDFRPISHATFSGPPLVASIGTSCYWLLYYEMVCLLKQRSSVQLKLSDVLIAERGERLVESWS